MHMQIIATQGFEHYGAVRRGQRVAVSPGHGLRLIEKGLASLATPLSSTGETWVCIASGPSLTRADVELVRQWRAQGGCKVIVVNSSWRLAPWADAVYAMDAKWWGRELGDLRAQCAGSMRLCTSGPNAAKKYGLEHIRARNARGLGRDVVHLGGNSGYGAINLAYLWGAARIVLLGYDMQPTGGRSHWHGDHPDATGPLPTREWLPRFSALAADLAVARVEVVNATRETALQCFARAPLETLAVGRPPVMVDGMHGLGDNLHQRAIVRELAKTHEVWLETPWPSVYHALPVHLVSRGSRLRTQARNARRERDRFEALPDTPMRRIEVKYPPAEVRRHGGVLAAMSAQCGVALGDFSLPVPWSHGLELPDRPILVLRPMVERAEWGGNRARNPDLAAWTAICAALRERFFVVSVADLEPDREWLAQPAPDADLVLHAGELDFQRLAALWKAADLVLTPSGFGIVLAQAVGTPVISVFGGYERGYSFSAGATRTPTLAIEPIEPCDCFSHRHKCRKAIDIPAALERVAEFVESQCAR